MADKDPVWEHVVKLFPGFRCNYCLKEWKSGKASRLKDHMAGRSGDIVACTKCPPDIRNYFQRELPRTMDRKYEVLLGGQMQGVQSAKRISPHTKTRLAGSQSMPLPKAPKENVVVDNGKLPYSGSKLGDLGLSVGVKDVTYFKSLPTPINLYEDECVFCHSFRTSQFHGPMERYLNGRIVFSDESNPSSGIYVHRKCLEWAPRVWFEGDMIRNFKSEIGRASRLKCHRCGLQGAALGCYYKLCNKSFHVPCAIQIYDCRWDVDERLVLCPEHRSQVLPCDKLSSQTKERHQYSSSSQSQGSHKEESIMTFKGEGQQVDQLNTRSSSLSLGQSSHKAAVSTHSLWEGQQIDQLIASSSSPLHMSCIPPDEEGMFSACQGEEMKVDQQETSIHHPDKMVLLGSSLSASEKDSLEVLACCTEATVTNEWGENVTHVIVGKDTRPGWHRTYEILMAILFGQWVVQAEWTVDCLDYCLELRRGREASYEVTFSDDPHKPLDGPKKGRTRAAEGGPKLFSGLHFCLSSCMNPGDKGRMRNLIAAAGGRVLERTGSMHCSACATGDSSQKPYFVYHVGAPGPAEFSVSSLHMEIEEIREHVEAGALVISHLTVMDAVAAYDVNVLERLPPRFMPRCP